MGRERRSRRRPGDPAPTGTARPEDHVGHRHCPAPGPAGLVEELPFVIPSPRNEVSAIERRRLVLDLASSLGRIAADEFRTRDREQTSGLGATGDEEAES